VFLIGGIAFETPATGPVLPPAEPNSVFKLFSDRAEAMKPPQGEPKTYVLIFRQSVRGLLPGAPVEISGIPIGEVMSIGMDFDVKTFGVSIPVTVKVYSEMVFGKLNSKRRRHRQDSVPWRVLPWGRYRFPSRLTAPRSW
jgi:paraquat-inducible protein B